jgi:predicted nucleotidyltransferase
VGCRRCKSLRRTGRRGRRWRCGCSVGYRVYIEWVSTLADAALTADERALLERFGRELEQSLGDSLHAVWLFGSRARGEAPLREDSDVDVLVLADDASWDGKRVVHKALDAAARELGLDAVGWSFSIHVNTPEWLAERRALRSFFVAEVDRDKLVVAGHG